MMQASQNQKILRRFRMRPQVAVIFVLVLSVLGAAWLMTSKAATPPNGPDTALRPGDVNGDGKVNQLDINIVNANWQKQNMARGQGDLNGDGTVNYVDLSAIASHWDQP
jgi:hypothetical protein